MTQTGATRRRRASRQPAMNRPDQRWTWRTAVKPVPGPHTTIFAFWRADVHSVGGYVNRRARCSRLGIACGQVLIALIAGIVIVQVLRQPGCKVAGGGRAHPVINRHIFG